MDCCGEFEVLSAGNGLPDALLPSRSWASKVSSSRILVSNSD
jgi:hypothetical protein